MRKTTLAVTISSLLFAAVAAKAEPGTDTSQNQQAQATPQTDTSRPSTTSTAPDADTATGTSSTGTVSSDQANPDVGSAESNVDEKSSSGSYYPYSAGTAGDDPSEPTSTSVPSSAGDSTSGPTDQWMDPAADADGDGYLSQDELAKVAPTLASSFSEMDVDGDKKLTRAEYRTWHESHKARMDADQSANPASGSPQNSDPATSTTTGTSRDAGGTAGSSSSSDSAAGTTDTTTTEDSTSSSDPTPDSNN
jgi:hypothetical protein